MILVYGIYTMCAYDALPSVFPSYLMLIMSYYMLQDAS